MQSHELLQEWAETVTREEVNVLAATYLSYISHYRAEEELLAAAEKGEGEFVVPPGPVRMTSIVACLPAFTDPSGQSSGDSPFSASVTPVELMQMIPLTANTFGPAYFLVYTIL